jgi:hypothetical protein
MKKLFPLYIVLFIITVSGLSPLFAQGADQDSIKDDSSDFSWVGHHKRHRHRFSNWNFEIPDIAKGKPFIELGFGRADSKINTLNENLHKNGLAQVKLGYRTQTPIDSCEKLLKYSNHFAELSFLQDNIWKDNSTSDLKTETLRFGFGWESGYGYDLGRSALLLTNTFGVNWNRLRVMDPVSSMADYQKLALYDDAYRFGISHEANIRLQLIPELSVNASYEKNAVFQRVLFWKLSASVLTEAIADGLVNEFIKEVKDSSPFAAPILSFVLKSGVAYGFSELRKEHMNVPFGGEDPLMLATYKFGLTFNF